MGGARQAVITAPRALAAGKPTASPAWVTRSNQLAQILLDAQGPFQPEETGFFGVPGYDDKVGNIELVEALGEPLHDGYLPAGSMHSNGQSQFVIAIAGPQGKGRVFLNAKRSGDHWDYPMLYVVTDSKDAIDLAALDDIEAADSCALEECRAKGECPPSPGGLQI